MVPVDPALQAYANGAFTAMEAPMYATNSDGIVSSIEQQAEGDVSMSGIDFTQHNGQAQGTSVESLTPGPPPHNHTQGNGYQPPDVQTNGYPEPEIHHAQANGYQDSTPIHIQTNGYDSKAPHEHNAVRHPSSPVSPGTSTFNQYMTTSPTMSHANNHYAFTTNSDFPPPPTTPARNQKTPSRHPASKTPNSGSRQSDSKDGIKLESGLGMSMMTGGMDMLIDPSLDQASRDLIKQLELEDRGLRDRRRQS